MYYNNFFDDFDEEESGISAELRDVNSELHDAQRKWKHKKRKVGRRNLKNLTRRSGSSKKSGKT